MSVCEDNESLHNESKYVRMCLGQEEGCPFSSHSHDPQKLSFVYIPRLNQLGKKLRLTYVDRLRKDTGLQTTVEWKTRAIARGDLT